jgi:hypothetical protein
MRTSLSEIGIDAAQTAKTKQKMLKMGRQRPQIAFMPRKRRRSGR